MPPVDAAACCGMGTVPDVEMLGCGVAPLEDGTSVEYLLIGALDEAAVDMAFGAPTCTSAAFATAGAKEAFDPSLYVTTTVGVPCAATVWSALTTGTGVEGADVDETAEVEDAVELTDERDAEADLLGDDDADVLRCGAVVEGVLLCDAAG